MSRDEFIDYLARLVQDEVITEAQAVQFLAEFDAEELEDLQLPLPPTEIHQEKTEEDIANIVAALILFLQVDDLESIPHSQRVEFIDAVQDGFDIIAERLAEQRVNKVITVREWQRAVYDAISDHTTRQSLLGLGGSMTPDQLARVNTLNQVDAAFLSRFGDEMAAQEWLFDRAMTQRRIAARTKLYGRNGRAEAYKYSEQSAVDNGQLVEGWVIDYISIPDNRRCRNCATADAAGPYLPTFGPMPTQICLGFYACRCKRVPRYDPVMWQYLSGLRGQSVDAPQNAPSRADQLAVQNVIADRNLAVRRGGR